MWYGSTERQIIIKAVETDGQITNIEISEMFAISKASLDSMARTMENLELIQRVRTLSGVYRLEPTDYSKDFLEMTSRNGKKKEDPVKLALLVEETINEMVSRGDLIRPEVNFLKMTPATTAASPRPAKKPTVLIVGLLDEQARKISDEYEKRLNLRFWKNHNVTKLKSLASQSDITLMLSSFLSHSHEEAVRDSTSSWKRVFGGMSSVRRELDAFVEK